jgi:hypothetical protein
VKTVQMTAAREVAAVNLSLGHRPDRVVPDCCPYADIGIRTIRALHLAGVWQIRSAPRAPGGDSVQARRMPARSRRHW